VGRISGLIIAASTVGSIVGVFFAGYVLIDHLRMSVIFRLTGVLIACLALLCLGADRWLRDEADDDKPSQ
jgi:predicted MFS family arabinose efflux permease